MNLGAGSAQNRRKLIFSKNKCKVHFHHMFRPESNNFKPKNFRSSFCNRTLSRDLRFIRPHHCQDSTKSLSSRLRTHPRLWFSSSKTHNLQSQMLMNRDNKFKQPNNLLVNKYLAANINVLRNTRELRYSNRPPPRLILAKDWISTRGSCLSRQVSWQT